MRYGLINDKIYNEQSILCFTYSGTEQLTTRLGIKSVLRRIEKKMVLVFLNVR